MLNILWPIFIIISIIYAIFSGNIENLNKSIFESTESAVNLTLTLLGTTCLWSGIMEIASKTQIIEYLSKMLRPIIKRLFSGLNEKSSNNITMNIIANMLGLGNAATPLGLKAMKELQKENKNKQELSDNMMMLIVLNTASLQIIPTTIIAIRSSLGSANPTKIIVPVWISTICAAIVGIIFTKIIIRITKKWKDKWKYMQIVNYISIIAMPLVILVIVFKGLREKINVFDVFLKGATDGVEICLRIFPTLIGLFVAIGVLRSSGILDFITKIISPILSYIRFPSEIVPLALLRPISGSASMAVATDIITQNGVDSFIGILAAVIMGATETTLYTIAVYTSSVKIKNTRGILIACLAADITGIVISLIVCRIIF